MNTKFKFVINKRNGLIIIVSFLIVLIILVRINIKTSESYLTEVQVLTSVVDFGDLPLNEEVDCSILLKNIGEQKLKIDRTTSLCNCNESKTIYPIVLPGDSIRIVVKVKPVTHGDFYKKVFIFCNVPDSPIAVFIRGKIY